MKKTAEEIMIDNFEGYSFSSDLEPVIIQCMQEFASQTRWIDVYDRLPESDGSYMVFNHDNEIAISYFYKDDCEFSYPSVKYWMPLPEAPKDNSGTAESA